MVWIKLKRRRRFISRLLRGQQPIRMYVVWRGHCALQRPFALLAPLSAYKDAAFCSFVGIATSHHKDANRRLAIYAILNSFQPTIEPALLESQKINRRIRTELSFPGVATRATTVSPRSHN